MTSIPTAPDAYLPQRQRIAWRRVAILTGLGSLLAGAALAAPATLYVHACVEGRCRTVALSVDSCIAGGQAAMAQWKADHPGVEVKAFYCDDKGMPA